jgi:hypothetical protein
VLAALVRKAQKPQVEMGGHLLARKVLKNFEAGGDPDTGPRARVKGEEAGVTESLLDRGDACTTGGVFGVAGAND